MRINLVLPGSRLPLLTQKPVLLKGAIAASIAASSEKRIDLRSSWFRDSSYEPAAFLCGFLCRAIWLDGSFMRVVNLFFWPVTFCLLLFSLRALARGAVDNSGSPTPRFCGSTRPSFRISLLPFQLACALGAGRRRARSTAVFST